ncbi:hypothetical protein K504DRAFT_458401 [Pleomassaria siparia CBS 279.74]|uniref:Uncharacterized protein n=1 Tax=Pleomassaria siparia CBS 279.74 TaxID=1314801 RepID=A0A6G1K6B4_9PLEO|nr:hypothetical protein K504DRAFT_458401 [Pleomassaria siparia CBS 279.74]
MSHLLSLSHPVVCILPAVCCVFWSFLPSDLFLLSQSFFPHNRRFAFHSHLVRGLPPT